jgi:hypothetical protein
MMRFVAVLEFFIVLRLEYCVIDREYGFGV